MKKLALKDRKAKLVAVLVDLNKKTILWRSTAGKLAQDLEHNSSVQDEWMDLSSSREKGFATLATEPSSVGGESA